MSIGSRISLPALSDSAVRRLSWRAIELAFEHPSDDLREITAFLYFYNRLPLDRAWSGRMSDVRAVEAQLGLDAQKPWPGSRIFLPVPPTDPEPVWRFWYPHGRDTRRIGDGTVKLYVCPFYAELSVVIAAVGSCLDRSGVKAVKVGFTPAALLRPDKLIFYFNHIAAAVELGRKLHSAVCLRRAQPVPFSCALDAAGLTSVGFDPPATARWLDGGHGNSWRLWIAEVVADQILRHRRAGKSLETIAPGLYRRGIDPVTWQPRGCGLTRWAR